MDGIHDIGGMHGFGPVPLQDENYVFKHDWQRRSFALAQALAGPTPYCADMHRFKIEQLPPADYLRMDYFEKWAIATSKLLVDAGLVDDEELKSGDRKFEVDLIKHPPVEADALIAALKQGVKMDFPSSTAAAGFVVGETVRVSANAPSGHTRVPRYVRGRLGTVTADLGVFQFADSMAIGKGPEPQHCYTVSFKASALWGSNAENATDETYLDLAESYLERD